LGLPRRQLVERLADVTGREPELGADPEHLLLGEPLLGVGFDRVELDGAADHRLQFAAGDPLVGGHGTVLVRHRSSI